MSAVTRGKLGAIVTAFAAALVSGGVLGAGSATTGTAGNGPSLIVSASVAANCTITTAPVVFGAYDPIAANAAAVLQATGTVSIACTKGATAISVGLGGGGNSGSAAPGTTRAMAGGTLPGFLSYELFKPSAITPNAACAYTSVWGSGANVFSVENSPSKASRTYNICGQVPAGQDVSVGSYTDTVVATVNF